MTTVGRSERMRSKMMAREMMLQSINGTITYHEKRNVSDQETNISIENSVACRGSHSFTRHRITGASLRPPTTGRSRLLELPRNPFSKHSVILSLSKDRFC